ncbi:hypothetical protein OHA21_22250 [Actinoplanes sp. NBC_00393]|uniref:hypothetical protein n=1 Tax=Actinoplanes sp. NBC_00393 TaxID=2975953 RepID=UPI002E1FC5C3
MDAVRSSVHDINAGAGAAHAATEQMADHAAQADRAAEALTVSLPAIRNAIKQVNELGSGAAPDPQVLRSRGVG